MPLFHLGELRAFLEQHGLQAKKSLSQNFLIDGSTLNRILDTADIHEGDWVVEIGPGPGTLTEGLLKRGAHILAIEKDRLLAGLLPRLDPKGTLLEVIEGDALQFPYEQKLPERLRAGQKAKVVANLPYQAATALVLQLLPHHTLFSSIVVMVQEEVARRFTALPGGKDYGSLSLYSRFHSTPRYGFLVPSSAFYPRPKVESAIISFDLHPAVSSVDEGLLFGVIRQAFNYRRKMLRSSLRQMYGKEPLEKAFEACKFTGQERPEQLDLQAFEKLAAALGPPDEA